MSVAGLLRGDERLEALVLVGARRAAGGVVYLVLTVYGAVIDLDSAANVVLVNVADNVLHLGLDVAMIGLGLVLGRQALQTPAAAAR